MTKADKDKQERLAAALRATCDARAADDEWSRPASALANAMLFDA